MSKVSFATIGSLVTNPTSAQTDINSNFTAIQSVFDNTFSRDGTSPNTIGATVDMNSNQIINLPVPATANSPVRLQDLSTVTGGGTVVNVPVGGNTGQVLTKTSNVNYAMNWVSPGSTTVFSTPGGRLTLTTAVPVLNTTVSGATTVFYTPYTSATVIIYDGTNMIPTFFTELSQATTDTTKSPAAVAASSIYDIFVWNDSGTIRATRGPAWTNNTTRANTLVRVNGILLNSSSVTNGPAAQRGTYVGTIASNASSTIDFILGGSASGGLAASLGVWNNYNRVTVTPSVIDTGTVYTYTSTTVRQARGSTGNQISFVSGLQEEGGYFSLVGVLQAASSITGVAALVVGLGLDTTTGYTSPKSLYEITATVGQLASGVTSVLQVAPQIGIHVISSNENSDGVNANQYDLQSTNVLSGSLRM